MKHKLKKRLAQLLALSLMIMVTVGFVPQMAAPVYSAEDEPAGFPLAITYGPDVLDYGKDSTFYYNPMVVYYGGGDKAKQWRIISYGDKGNYFAKKDGVMTLFAWENLGTSKFNSDKTKGNEYKDSTLQGYLNNLYNGESALFTSEEQKAVVERTLKKGNSYYYDDPIRDCSYTFNTGIAGAETSGYLWPLSTVETLLLADDAFMNSNDDEFIQLAQKTNPSALLLDFWLRSPAKSPSSSASDFVHAACASQDRDVNHWTNSVDQSGFVRPAFYLDLDSVLFTSEAGEKAGKSLVKEVSSDGLVEVSKAEGIYYKLTLRDDKRNSFKTENVQMTPGSDAIVVNYEGATTGVNEYISAVIKDGNTGKISYYGRIKNIKESSESTGNVTIKLSGKYHEGDTLYVFNEQYNGDNKTDYASDLQPVTKISCTVTFKVKNGTWDDGETEAKTVELSGDYKHPEGLILEKKNIPQVGSKPDSNYKEGSWDVTPRAGKMILWNTTYTYTYAETNPSPFPDELNPTPSLDPTPTPTPTPTPGPTPSSGLISIQDATVVLSPEDFTYNGKVQKPAIETIGGGKLVADTDYTAEWSDADSTDAGEYTVTITGKGKYYGTTKASYVINKAANPLKVKGKTAKVKSKKLKKKAQKLKVTKVIKFKKKGKGAMSYKLVSAKKGKKSFKKYFKINKKTGKVTIKKNKKMKKGTYKVKVKVKAAGNKNYKASSVKKVTFKIKVK